MPLWSGCIQQESDTQNPFNENTIFFYDSIIAGDGYYYLTYACNDLTPVAQYPDGTNEYMVHRRLIRIDTSGNATDMPVADSRTISTYFGMALGPVRIITNVLTRGVMLVWRPWYSGVAVQTQQPLMAITSGTSVAVTNGPQPADEGVGDVIRPTLQLQDGSYAGSYVDANGNTNIAAFDMSGNVHWVVPNDTPTMATADGGVIGKLGTTYDQSGNATGFAVNSNSGVSPGWLGNVLGFAYSDMGSNVSSLVAPNTIYAATFAAFLRGSPSTIGTAMNWAMSKFNTANLLEQTPDLSLPVCQPPGVLAGVLIPTCGNINAVRITYKL